MIHFGPENVELIEGEYLPKVRYVKKNAGGLIIGGSRVEQDASEMALSPLVGLLQNLQILMLFSLAHLLKKAKKFSMSGLKSGDKIAKHPFKPKN